MMPSGKYLQKYSTALFFSVLTVTIVLFQFGFYWEDWQGYLTLGGSGIICTTPPHGVAFLDPLFLQFPIIINLAKYFNRVPVFGIWHFCSIILFVSLWFHLSLRVLSRKINSHLLVIVYSHLLVWGIIGMALVYVNVTRDSILLLSGSMLLYVDYYKNSNVRARQFVILSVLAVFMRVTSGIVALSAVTVLIGLLFFDIKLITRSLILQWTIAVVSIVMVMGYNPSADMLEIGVEKYERPVTGGAIVPLSEMKTAEDTLRYEALVNYFMVTDTAKINFGFMNKVVDLHKYHYTITNKEGLMHIKQALLPLINDYKYNIILFYVLLLCLCFKTKQKTLQGILLFNFYCWGTLIILTLKVTMQPHFFVPWLSMIFGGSVFLCLLDNSAIKKWQELSMFCLLLVMIVFVAKQLNGYSMEEREANKRGHLYLSKLKEISKNKIPVIWDHAPQIPNEILQQDDVLVLKKCVYLSIYPLMFYDFGQDRCRKVLGFNPLDYKNMNMALTDNRNKIVFITEDSFAHFLETYYQAEYHMNFKLERDSVQPQLAEGLYAFHLVTTK